MGSGLYSDQHSGYLCFHGIIYKFCVDKNGNTNLYYSPKAKIDEFIERFEPLNIAHTEKTAYLLDYFTTKAIHTTVVPLKIKSSKLKYPLMIDSTDYITICKRHNTYVDQPYQMFLLYEVNNERNFIAEDVLATLRKDLQKVFKKNAIYILQKCSYAR